MLDDLCAAFIACEEAGVRATDLAALAAEGEPAVAAPAAMLYAASALLQHAGVRFDSVRHWASAKGDDASKIVAASSLSEAIVKARASGACVLALPRDWLANPRLNATDVMQPALLALGAAMFGQRDAIAAFLRAAPLAMDELVVERMLATAPTQGSFDLKALALGAPHVHRESLLRAAQIVAELQSAHERGVFDLAKAATLAADLLAEDGPSSVGSSSVVEAAKAAARVWAAGEQPVPAAAQVQLLGEALTCRATEGARLVTVASIWPADLNIGPRETSLGEQLLNALDRRPHRAPVDIVVASGDDLSRHEPAAPAPSSSWSWPEADEPSLVTVPGMVFSASRLNSYVKCGRRWFFEYLCAALEEPASIQTAYGRVLHAALEALHRDVRVPNKHSAEDMLRRLTLELDLAFGRSRADFDSQLAYEISRQRARRMAEQYVRWLATESARAPMEIVHVELQRRLQRDGYEFVGYIDRIDRPVGGGPVTIYDYKTGRIAEDASEYLDDVRKGAEAQLALYYAMWQPTGEPIERVALVSLHDPRDEVWMLSLDLVTEAHAADASAELSSGIAHAACTPADLDRSFKALVERCDLLTKHGVEHFAPGDDPPCAHCVYNIACRERPAPEVRVFAR